MSTIDFNKNNDGLVPVIIQDVATNVVLMLGYMNEEAYQKTLAEKKVTFYSRTKQRLWTKGETSENYLYVENISIDCDNDTLLIKVRPAGPTCHTGDDTCFKEANVQQATGFINTLEQVIANRKANPDDKSYTASLFKKGINKVAQKVGEEAVETVIEAMDNNDELFLNESADLLFHYLVLLQAKGFTLKDIVKVLEARH